MLISRTDLTSIIDKLVANGFSQPISGNRLQTIAEEAEGCFAFEGAFVAISEPLTPSEAIAASQELHRIGMRATPEALASLWLQIATWRTEGAIASDRAM